MTVSTSVLLRMCPCGLGLSPVVLQPDSPPISRHLGVRLWMQSYARQAPACKKRERDGESIEVVLQRTDVKQPKVERAIEFKQMWLYLLLNISEIKKQRR